MMLQLPGGPPAPSWSRAAIHDSVAAIARQRPYWRNPRTSPIERMLQWIVEQLERFFRAVDSVPHGRRIATVAAVVLAVLVIARLAYATRLRGEPLVGQRLHRSRRQLSPDAWHEAEGLAAAGEYTAAAHALYRAALALLSARGLVRLHESKTSGDYARELRRRAAAGGASVYAAFRRFGARYDRIIYGTGHCDAEGYEALLAAARSLLEADSADRAA